MPSRGLAMRSSVKREELRVEEEVVQEVLEHVRDDVRGQNVSYARFQREKMSEVKGVTIVQDVRTAARVVSKLVGMSGDSMVAWDTETTGVDPSKESPVGRGSIICATAFAGCDVDFGTGPRLFVDCLDGERGPEMLNVFKGYFENEACKKVWHNYSFDKHVLANHGIEPAGFGADTMHMARLVDSSRKRYSLEELCKHYLDRGLLKKNMTDRFEKSVLLKDKKTEAKKKFVPSTVDLQQSLDTRLAWIDYATADAELTHRLYQTLKTRLEDMFIQGENAPPLESRNGIENLLHLYTHLMVPLGKMLTDIENVGFKVDVEYLRRAELEAEKDRIELEDSFRDWAKKRSPDAKYMNVNSDRQKQQLFFAPCVNVHDKTKSMPTTKSFTVEQTGVLGDRFLAEQAEHAAAAALNGADGNQKSEDTGKKKNKSKKLKKEVVLHGLGKKFSEVTTGGWPSVSATAMKKLAGSPRADPPVYGDPSDPAMCRAIDSMIEASAVSTLMSTFIGPLQSWPDENGRIHASLNLNTETGRLSSRRPNLQNQPALEKDRYQVRKAFVCERGNRLIVADYGQLELRLLAHITNCKSMIEAFEAGGDFHSRTAITMFDHVKASVQNGECLLERNEEGDEGNAKSRPLLKDMFSTERRKAKTLNFSIAYGKTVSGLARDWNVSTEEARATLNLWYKERKEVREWQKNCIEFAHNNLFVETLMGRRRNLPDIASKNFRVVRHAERAAINAPLQGSAADLVMAAMVKLHHNRILRALGWKVILQVHDEIILEGPEHSTDLAMPIVLNNMKYPVDFSLNVDLTVDAKSAGSWYAAK